MMYHQEQIKELICITWHYTRPIFWIVTIITAAISIYDRYFKHEEPQVHTSYWINADESRSVTDIKHLDYDRRLIIYRPEGRYEGFKEDNNTRSADGDFTDWYDLDDYYDLYEYYHD